MKPQRYLISDDEQANKLITGMINTRPYQQADVRTGVRASEISNCMRRTWYELANTDPDSTRTIDNVSSFIMDMGSYFEDFITRRFQLMKDATWRGKARIRHRRFPLTGETDQIVLFENANIVIECKFTHRDSFIYKMRNFQRGICDDRYYSQIQTYLWILPDIEYGIILIGNRDMRPNDNIPPLIWKRVDRDEEWQNNNENRLNDLVSHLGTNTTPEREFAFNSNECKWCPFRELCWDLEPEEVDNGDLHKPD